MLKNYLKIAWRSLTTSKTYSFINITGLALGLMACMLILLYAGHEWSYDRFHKNADRMYWVQAKLKLGGDTVYMPFIEYSTGMTAKNSAPFVESFLRIKQPDRDVVVHNVQSPSLKFAENKFLFADSNFFSFFSFRLLTGEKSQVLKKSLFRSSFTIGCNKIFRKRKPDW